MSEQTHVGHPSCPRQKGEDLGDYMERYSEWTKQFKPWEQPAPPSAPPQAVRLPFREAGDDDPDE